MRARDRPNRHRRPGRREAHWRCAPPPRRRRRDGSRRSARMSPRVMTKRGVGHAVDQRRLEEEALAVFGAGRRCAANQQPAAARSGILGVPCHAPPDAFVEHGTVEHARLDRRGRARSCLRLGGQRLDELVVDRLRDQDAIHGDADLAHVRERAPRRRRGCLGHVGVIEHDERALAAEFERQAFHLVGGGAHDRLAGGTEAVAVIMRMSACAESAAPALWPGSRDVVSTPAGRPASSKQRTTMPMASGVSCGGLATSVQPAASAGATFHM